MQKRLLSSGSSLFHFHTRRFRGKSAHKKVALPIIRMDATFLLLSSETISRLPLRKDFVNLRSKIL
ncbi:hypothetical protein DW103_08875 [Parabacteroides sp. AM08-6]|nr:hypothetical protein DW103_08875 [Parabacteroides sp. AM08-6]